MNTNEKIREAASTLSDDQVMEAIVLIDTELETLKGDAGYAHRTVRATLYAVLENRYPFLTEILDAWVEADDDRTYTEVIADALTKEYVLQ